MKTKLFAAIALLFSLGVCLQAQSFTPDFVLQWDVKYRGTHFNGHYTLDNTYFDIVSGKLTWIGPTIPANTAPVKVGSGASAVGSSSCTTTISGASDYCSIAITVTGALTTDNVILTMTSAPVTGSGPSLQHFIYGKITAANTLTVYGYASNSGGTFTADSSTTFNYEVVR